MREAECGKCGRKVPFYQIHNGACSICRDLEERKERDREQRERDERKAKLFLTTETSIATPIAARIGIVGSQCALGMNLFKDIFIGGRDLWGGRSDTLQQQIAEGRNTVIAEMKAQASAKGADAVIAVQISFSEFSGGGSRMLFIAATGTAVTFAAR